MVKKKPSKTRLQIKAHPSFAALLRSISEPGVEVISDAKCPRDQIFYRLVDSTVCGAYDVCAS